MIPKIHECLSKDEYREVLNYAYVTKEHTVATDAHLLVVHSTPELFDKEFVKAIPEEGMLLGGDALREMAKKTVEHIILNGQITVLHRKGGKAIFEVRKHGDLDIFPDWKSVMPKKEDNKLIMAIGIDAKKALRLQNALGIEQVGMKYYFTGEDKAIICEPINAEMFPSARGIIMPMQINY